MFTGRMNLRSPDTQIELVKLKKFRPNFDSIDGQVGSVRVEFNWLDVGLGENCEF